jgi:hypothetical protein
MSALTDLKAITIYVLTALLLVTGLAAWQYKRMYKAMDFALTTQNAAIKAQSATAEQLLKQRTAERDELQKKLDARAMAQGKTDEKAVAQIDADDKLQRAAPVRVSVRYVTRDAGCGSGGSKGKAAPIPGTGSEDASTGSGVLSQAASGRLADAIKEVEANSAAYSSCRATLIPAPG